MVHQPKHDRHAIADADVAFHLAVSAASGNRFFRSFAGVIEAALFVLLSITTAQSRKTHVSAAALHALVVDAIEAKDRSGAAEAMLRTIDAGYVHTRHAQKAGGSAKRDRL